MKTPKTKFTKSAFADLLGISRQSLAGHLRKPEAPPVGDVNAWQVYLAAHGRIGSAPDDLRRAIAQKRLEILEQTKIKLARENQVEAGLMMPRAEARRQNAMAWCFVFESLQRAENELPPSLAGLDSISIFQRLHRFTETMRKDAKERFEKAA